MHLCESGEKQHRPVTEGVSTVTATKCGFSEYIWGISSFGRTTNRQESFENDEHLFKEREFI